MTAPQDQTEHPQAPDGYQVQQQDFEVVLIRKDKHEASALPDDFKRVPVTAESTYMAMHDAAVEAEKEHRPLFAALPGALTEIEILARQRALSIEQDGDPRTTGPAAERR
jgi:hypothetical protein